MFHLNTHIIIYTTSRGFRHHEKEKFSEYEILITKRNFNPSENRFNLSFILMCCDGCKEFINYFGDFFYLFELVLNTKSRYKHPCEDDTTVGCSWAEEKSGAHFSSNNSESLWKFVTIIRYGATYISRKFLYSNKKEEGI